MVKHPPASAGDVSDAASIPGSGRSAGGGHGNPLMFLPGEPRGRRSLVGCTSEGLTESDTTEGTQRTHAEEGDSQQISLVPAGNRLRERKAGLPPASWPTAAVPCGKTGGPAPRVCRSVSRARAGQWAALPCRWGWILEVPSPSELRGAAGLCRLSWRLSPVLPPPLLPRPEQLSRALSSTPAQPAFITGTRCG